MVVEDGFGSGKAKKWKRFQKVHTGDYDYYYLSENYWDAICFVPQKAVNFMGFGLICHYRKQSVKYKLQWVIDGSPSEEYDVDFDKEDIDTETWTWEFTLK